MPKHNRLPRRQFPKRVSRRMSGALLSLSAATLEGLTEPKFTCVVSRKVSPSAVKRNTLKRRCREAIRPHLKDVPPMALIAYPKRTALEVPFSELALEIALLIGKITARG